MGKSGSENTTAVPEWVSMAMFIVFLALVLELWPVALIGSTTQPHATKWVPVIGLLPGPAFTRLHAQRGTSSGSVGGHAIWGCIMPASSHPTAIEVTG